MTAEMLRYNIRSSVVALDLARDNEVVITHGNGPQVGLLALQGLHTMLFHHIHWTFLLRKARG